MEKLLKEHYKKIVIGIFIIGIIVRLIYVTETPIRRNQYDCKIWSLYNEEDYKGVYELNEDNIGRGGHFYYIMSIYKTMKLPNGTGGQYYHPPLHHFISAMWLKAMDVLPLNEVHKIESLQVLSWIYSIIILIFCYRIVEKTKISEGGKVLSYLLINFFPLFIYMSGFVNNDLLVTVFTMASLYYLIKWNEKPSIKNTVLIALSIGLGMMTKTSIAVMMLPIFLVVFLKLLAQIKAKKNIKEIIIQILIFSIIAGSLSMWYQIRNHNKYGTEFFMIQQPYEHFYAGDASKWERWGVTSKELIKNTLAVDDKNIFATVLNSGLYCLEGNSDFYCYMIKELTIVLGVIAIIEILKKTYKSDEIEKILLITFVSWVLGFVVFNIKLPYSCTMNSRYIPILFTLGIIMNGYFFTETKKSIIKYLICALSITLAIFSLATVL